MKRLSSIFSRTAKGVSEDVGAKDHISQHHVAAHINKDGLLDFRPKSVAKDLDHSTSIEDDDILKKIREFREGQANMLLAASPELYDKYDKLSKVDIETPNFLSNFID